MSADDDLGFEEGMDDLSDEFGDFGDDLDDGFDDDFGGFDDDDSEELAELEDRIGELENEVSAISSGMNTVREENKQIGETVEELDDTIRKLLDIYEMVTRGINPFVDDAREMGGLDSGGSFGLFEAETEDEEHLDPEVANADAESFFDDDFGELDAEAGAQEAELAAEDELSEAERESPAATLDDAPAAEDDEPSGGGGGGASFDDLKQQYEENDGWDEVPGDADEAVALAEPAESESDPVGDAAESEVEPDDAEPATEPDDAEPNADAEPASPDVELDGDTSDDGGAEDAETTIEELEAEYASAAMTKDEVADESAGADTDRPADAAAGDEAVESTDDGDPDAEAYLASVPADYVAEVLAVDWAAHLVDAGGTLGAARALRQYREQGWISRVVENELYAHVGAVSASVADAEDADLALDDHQASLGYVSRLAGDVPDELVYEELVASGEGFDGIRC